MRFEVIRAALQDDEDSDQAQALSESNPQRCILLALSLLWICPELHTRRRFVAFEVFLCHDNPLLCAKLEVPRVYRSSLAIAKPSC